MKFVGPALVVAVAYVDPGNIATNVQAGARYGYSVLWVTLIASGLAMLVQALSAKLGIVTRRNLAELSRERLPMPLAMWIVSEVAAMATDLAKVLDGAIGLSLFLHMPLLQKRGFGPLEMVVGALVDVVGATVMSHTLFLHSSLTQSRVSARNETEHAQLLKYSHAEVDVTLTLAAIINVAMIVMAAGAFHHDHADVAQIQTAYHTLWLRRAITMMPSFVVIGMGVNVTQALIDSQVALSLALPSSMIALGML